MLLGCLPAYWFSGDLRTFRAVLGPVRDRERCRRFGWWVGIAAEKHRAGGVLYSPVAKTRQAAAVAFQHSFRREPASMAIFLGQVNGGPVEASSVV